MKETGYLLQAALISVWWVGLASSPSFFDAFQYDGIPPNAFWAFFAPDVLLIAGLSTVRAYRNSPSIEHIVLGAFGYASLYCCNAAVLTNSGYLPTGLMLLGFLYNVFLCFDRSLFRASSTSLLRNVAKTLIQIVCFWSLALIVIPYVILDAFDASMRPEPGASLIAGLFLFVCFSTLGLTSAYFVVREGGGTPLPMDQTNRLVVSGPYRYVRNPMAIGGLGQGISIAIIFQSAAILVYCVLGALVWHLVVRPIEERNLAERFGESYCEYRRCVACWIPSFRSMRKPA